MNAINKEELEQYQKDTSGIATVIHFNNAGSSLPPDVVVDTVVEYLREEALKGGYETEAKYSSQLEQVYESIAKLIGAQKEEIAICENASAAWLTAFKGLQLNPGNEVITSELEYVSNLLALIDAKNAGIKVIVINNDEQGNFPLDKLEASINSNTKLVAVTHIPSSGGGIIPIEAIGQIVKKHDILYMVDACQTAGHYPIDVNAIGCDILSATGRKYIRAPRGTGFLYVNKRVQDRIAPLLLDAHAARNITLESYELRNDARRFELYEKSRALTLGLGKAVDYALSIGIDRIWSRVQSLASYARTALLKINGLTVHDIGDQQCGIITFSIDGFESLALRDSLSARGINVSFGGPSATLIYMTNRNLTGLVRVSVHYYNTEAEVDRLCERLKEICL